MNHQLDTLRRLWRDKIPLTQAMEVQLDVNEGQCQVSAPLAPNSNHMNTGFGGSLATLATLAGWSQTWLALKDPENYHIVIAHSDVRFTAPAQSDLCAVATTPSNEEITKLNEALTRKSRGALTVQVSVLSDNHEVALFTGKFVAVSKTST